MNNKGWWITAGAILAVIVSSITVYTFVEGRAKSRADWEAKVTSVEASIKRLEQRFADWKQEVNKDIWVLEGKTGGLDGEINAIKVEIAKIHK